MNSNKILRPEHVGNPQWQSMKEWIKMRPPQSIDYKMTKEETQAEQFERFGLVQETGGWGDASEAQDAGWGASSGNKHTVGGW